MNESSGTFHEVINGGAIGAAKIAGPAVNLKILVPAVASGAIIGKGGETIADIQKQTGTRIKMSKANDFYPGTTERVGLLQGPPDSVLMVMDFITEKIMEKPDPTAKPAIDFDNKICAEREKQIKVIVPNSTAGMIIGKGGSFIKQLKDESGAFIQISQKSKETTLPERVVTIIGDPNNNRKAIEMIICKILEDPQSSSCLNISYGEIQGLVANPHPTGSPYAPVIPNGASAVGGPPPPPGSLNVQSDQKPNSSSSHATVTSVLKSPTTNVMVTPATSVSAPLSDRSSAAISSNPFSVNLSNGRILDLSINTVPGWPTADPTLMSQYLQKICVPLRSHGFTDNTVDEIVRSIKCLANHGILTLDTSSSKTPPPAIWNQDAMVTPDINRAISPSTNSDLLRLQQSNMNVNSYGLVTGNQNEDVVDMEVQENVIGAVIGPAGRSIVELQQFSGARIQVSKKGAFSPGTRNRVVTISGPHQAVATAKYLIEKRIQEEDENRLASTSNSSY